MGDQKFPHTWVLWYHDPENPDYSMNGYVRIADLSTPVQFWSVVDAIPRDAWECGMYFFMKAGMKPIWESPEHNNGGSWSKKIELPKMLSTFTDLMIQCIAKSLMIKNEESLAGITISPKGPFSILKIWNTNTAFHDRALLNPSLQFFPVKDDVTYTAHKSRRR